MIVKAFEVRDSMTFIPVIAIKMIPTQQGGRFEQERYLLARSGYGKDPRANPLVMVCRMDANGGANQSAYDPHSWDNRTMTEAHRFIRKHFDEMFSGDVVDVQFILGEAQSPKLSEREMRDITQPKPPSHDNN